MKYLISVVDTYRVDTVLEAQQLGNELRTDPQFTLVSFGYKTKQIKEKGEVVEEYQLVSAKKVFNDEKDPTSQIIATYDENCIKEDLA